MNKVKEEFHYKVKEIETGELYNCYILLDVADDEEGFGVVFGSDEEDETIAFGSGDLSTAVSRILFDCIVHEIQTHMKETGKGYLLNTNILDFYSLTTPYDWVNKEVASDKDAENNLVRIMAYIAVHYDI